MTSKMHNVVTGEMLAQLRKQKGKVWVPREPYFNTQATPDSIRHFVNGTGDTNPLFCDGEYAL
ncbi:hypothetical protein ACFLTV_01030 [Chloroflexota bacterium]